MRASRKGASGSKGRVTPGNQTNLDLRGEECRFFGSEANLRRNF